GAIAELTERYALAADHAEHQVAGRGPLTDGRRADRPADTGQDRLHLLVAGRRLVAGSAVEIAHGREPAPQSAGAPPEGRLDRQEGARVEVDRPREEVGHL